MNIFDPNRFSSCGFFYCVFSTINLETFLKNTEYPDVNYLGFLTNDGDKKKIAKDTEKLNQGATDLKKQAMRILWRKN